MKPYELIDGGLYKVGDKVVKYDFSSHYFIDGKYHYALSRSGPGDVMVVTPITFTIALLEPIPLTAEILEKNGMSTNGEWVDSDALGEELIWREGRLDWTINCDEYVILSVYYVHELQHLLRLCGRNELADSIII